MNVDKTYTEGEILRALAFWERYARGKGAIPTVCPTCEGSGSIDHDGPIEKYMRYVSQQEVDFIKAMKRLQELLGQQMNSQRATVRIELFFDPDRLKYVARYGYDSDEPQRVESDKGFIEVIQKIKIEEGESHGGA